MLRRGKTAEVRFNMLARGWPAYPVTPMRTQLPPKCGCRNAENHRHIHRRGATALFRNPVRGAKRMRAGILRILHSSRAGGTPLPMVGRLTQLAKIFPVIYTTALRR